MPRPRLCRRTKFSPKVSYFKPQGIPMTELEEVRLSREEMESLKLKDLDGLEQVEAAKKMNTSQSTFQRILFSARKKVAVAIAEGKALRIDK